jgi:hypothetical protein
MHNGCPKCPQLHLLAYFSNLLMTILALTLFSLPSLTSAESCAAAELGSSLLLVALPGAPASLPGAAGVAGAH